MNILIINGPNLNLMGSRDANQYGNQSLDDINRTVEQRFLDYQFVFEQTNREGEIVEQLQKSVDQFDGVIINAGGFTHTSVAIRDAIEVIDIPVIEVHISNIAGRESFRHTSLLSPVCSGCIFGMGAEGYSVAVHALLMGQDG